MGTVEVFPDLLVAEANTSGRTITGAASVLLALNDSSDASYLTAAGTLAQNWSAQLRFAAPSIPAGAAIRHVQLRHRYSHNTSATPGRERFNPVTVLVGRQSGSKHIFDAYTTGERFENYSLSTSVQQMTFPARPKDFSGKYFMGERYQLLAGRRFYGIVDVKRHTANNQARIYSLSLVVTYDEKPTINLTQPSGTEVIARPPFDWTFSDPEGSVQQSFDARIYTATMAAMPDFDLDDIGRFPPEYQFTGYTPQVHHDVTRSFGVDGGSYVAYLRARTAYIWSPVIPYEDLSGVVLSPTSDWDSSAFTLDIATPRPPLVTAVYNPTIHGIEIEVAGQDNVLDYDDSTFEDSVAGWNAGASTTRAQTSAQALHGNDSMSLTRNATTGTANAIMANTVAIIGGEMYSAQAWFRAATTGRTCQVQMLFWNVADGIGLVGASSSSLDCTDVTTGWRQAMAWGMAPANADAVSVQVNILSAVATEVHYVDQVGVFPDLRLQMLTENQSSLETNTTGWAAGASSSIARDTANFYRGGASLAVTRTGSTGTGSATTPTGTSGVPALVGTTYTAAAWFKAATVGRQVRVSIAWYTSGAALISTSQGSLVSDTTTGWTQATVTAVAPATTAFATVIVEATNALATEVHYVDAIVLNPGSTAGEIAPWNEGGFLHDDVGMHIMELQRTTEDDEHGMPIWETIPEPRVLHLPRQQHLEFVDYEVPSNTAATYRARIEAEDHMGDMLNSGWSNEVTETMPVATRWYLRDPLDAGTLTMPLRISNAVISTRKPNTTDYPIGADAAVMTHDGIKEPIIRGTVLLLDETEYEMFHALTSSGATLLLQDTFGRQWYVQPDDGIEYEVLRAVKTPGEDWPTRHAHKVDITFISVERPRTLVSVHHG